MADVAERVERRCDDARHVAARVDDCIEAPPVECREVTVAVAAELLDVRKELGARLPAVEERHDVPARERGIDRMAAKELRAAENEDAHTLEPMSVVIRHAEPRDYADVIAVVDEWWGGRPMAAMLPKLFFVHFRDTSFAAEDGGRLAGFLCGFRSQTHNDEAYIHFVGVDPAHRGSGLGRELYDRFFAAVAPRTVISAVTSPLNERSVAFHRALGFEVERIDEDYDGQGQARVLLVKHL